MKFTNISKFIIKFMGGGKINFPFNYLKEVEINGDNDGESGDNGNAGGFDLDTFKQNIVDAYNKVANTPITTDNVIMPDAFVMSKNYNSSIPFPDIVDVDLIQFLASLCSNVPDVHPLYLKDSLVINNSNIYLAFDQEIVHFTPYVNLREETFDLPDGMYKGNLDLSKYTYLVIEGHS